MNEMFNMEDLARVYQNLLGDKYYSIDVNCNLSLDGNAVQGIMKPYRRPFKLENIHAETIEVSFEFYISVRKVDKKLDELKTLSKICGYQKGSFTSCNKTFNYHSFLDFATPASSPIVDYGDYTQCICIVGTCLVSASNGALVSNEIKTYLTINPNTENELTGQLEVLSFSYGVAKITESPQMANQEFAKGYNKSQSYTYNYTVLVMKNKICERLVKASRNIEPFGLNEVVKIKDIYPQFTTEEFSAETECIVTNCAFSGSAGAFATIEFSLQDALVLEDEE